MDKHNFFSKSMTDKSDIELQLYIDNQDQYQNSAILAAIWELERRDRIEIKVASEIIAKIEEDERNRKDLEEIGIPVRTVYPMARIMHWIMDGFFIQFLWVFIAHYANISSKNLLILLALPMYYIIFETFLGWTPGKYISNTIVVDSKGNKPNFRTIFIRSLIRLIPIEYLSCIGANTWGWHDKWTKTYVIAYEDLNNLRNASGLQNVDKDETTKNIELIIFILTSIIACAGAWFLFEEIRNMMIP